MNSIVRQRLQDDRVNPYRVNLIKEIRIAKGITQVQMAKDCGIARQTYIDLENGVKEPRLSLINSISDILEIQPSLLIYSKYVR